MNENLPKISKNKGGRHLFEILSQVKDSIVKVNSHSNTETIQPGLGIGLKALLAKQKLPHQRRDLQFMRTELYCD